MDAMGEWRHFCLLRCPAEGVDNRLLYGFNTSFVRLGWGLRGGSVRRPRGGEGGGEGGLALRDCQHS